MPWIWRSRNVWGRGIALVAAVLVLLSGEAFGVLARDGVVSGGIIPCQGIVISNGPQYAAGTVTVLKGQVTWKSTVEGNYVGVFPTGVVDQLSVAPNATYRFALEPGRYVLEARFPSPSNAAPYIDITVQPGDDVWVDIPNECI
jgi:hypothetical protein